MPPPEFYKWKCPWLSYFLLLRNATFKKKFFCPPANQFSCAIGKLSFYGFFVRFYSSMNKCYSKKNQQNQIIVENYWFHIWFGIYYLIFMLHQYLPGFNQGRKVEIISLKKLESGTWRKSSSPTSDILIFFW